MSNFTDEQPSLSSERPQLQWKEGAEGTQTSAVDLGAEMTQNADEVL